MVNDPKRSGYGPFRPEQLGPSDRYELSRGHAIYCAPTGGVGARAVLAGSLVIDTDPNVEDAAIDPGFVPEGGTLRAPDIAVGVPNTPGWVPGAPPLAVEYAGVGQDERDLQTKIQEFLTAGTRFVWVVRLVGPRRVEVHTPEGVRVLGGSDTLTAPGVLKKSIPVAALYDRELAHDRALENLLERFGYPSLEAVREEGREAGLEVGREEGLELGRDAGAREEAIKALTGIAELRLGPLGESHRAIIAASSLEGLRAMLLRAAVAPTLDEVFGQSGER